MEITPPRRFRDLGPLPAELRAPAAFATAVALAIVAGLAIGLLSRGPAAYRCVRAVFFASALAYLTVSIVDFMEHFRLERALTGRALTSQVIPLGETLNHWATGISLLLFLILARPLRPPIAGRDWLVLAMPAAFWILGWRDELVYHRRRTVHREDILHTVAHLAAAVMMSTFVALRLVRW